MYSEMSISALCSLYYKESASFLDDALQSLSVQSVQADEVVIVHDGPLTTDLYQCLSVWQEKLPIKNVILKKNVGLGVALNAGLNECKNELIARFDTDDINLPHRFELQASHMQNRSCAVVSAYVAEFDSSVDQIVSIKRVPKDPEAIVGYAKTRNPINHMAVMFRKSDVLDVGGYMNLPYLEDYYLWLRLIANGYRLSNIDDILVYARVGGGMYERRRGYDYIRSEFKLHAEKRRLGVVGFLDGAAVLAARSAPRILPTRALQYLYYQLRRLA